MTIHGYYLRGKSCVFQNDGVFDFLPPANPIGLLPMLIDLDTDSIQASLPKMDAAGAQEAVSIRHALPEEASAINALIRSVSHFFTLHPDGIGAEKFFESISPQATESNMRASNFRYSVLEIDGSMAGVVAIRDNKHLFHLFVSEAYQRRGYAKMLWHHARDEAIALGNMGEFTVNSSAYAVPVYESFGFVATGPRVEADGIAFVPMKLSS